MQTPIPSKKGALFAPSARAAAIAMLFCLSMVVVTVPSATSTLATCGPADVMGGSLDPLNKLPNVVVLSGSPLDSIPANHLHGWSQGDLVVISAVPLTVDDGLFTAPGYGGSIKIVAPSLHVTSDGFIATASSQTRISADPAVSGVGYGGGGGNNGAGIFVSWVATLTQTLKAGDVNLMVQSVTTDTGSCIATGNGSAGAGVTWHVGATVSAEPSTFPPSPVGGIVTIGAGGASYSIKHPCPLNKDSTCYTNGTYTPTDAPILALLGPALPMISGNGGAGGAISFGVPDALTLNGNVLSGRGGGGGDLAIDFSPTGLPLPNVRLTAGGGGPGGPIHALARTLVVSGSVTSGRGGDVGSLSIVSEILAHPNQVSQTSGGVGGVGAVIGLQAIESLRVLGSLTAGSGGLGGDLQAVAGTQLVTPMSSLLAGNAGHGGSIGLQSLAVTVSGPIAAGDGADGGDADTTGAIRGQSLGAGSGGQGGTLNLATGFLTATSTMNTGSGGNGGHADNAGGDFANTVGGQGGNAGLATWPDDPTTPIAIGAGGNGGRAASIVPVITILGPSSPGANGGKAEDDTDGVKGESGQRGDSDNNHFGGNGGTGCPAGSGDSAVGRAQDGTEGKPGQEGGDGHDGTIVSAPANGAAGGDGGDGGVGGDAFSIYGGAGGWSTCSGWDCFWGAICTGGMGGAAEAYGGNRGGTGMPGLGGKGGDTCLYSAWVPAPGGQNGQVGDASSIGGSPPGGLTDAHGGRGGKGSHGGSDGIDGNSYNKPGTGGTTLHRPGQGPAGASAITVGCVPV